MAAGRFEHKIQTEEKLKEMLVGKPDYVTGYYYSLSRKEYKTKSGYIYGVINYLKYLENAGININDPANLNLDNTNRYFDDAMYVVKNGVKKQATVSSMNGKWFCLNSFFKYMVGSGKVDSNPMDYIDKVRGKDNVKRVYMTAEDIAGIFKKFDYKLTRGGDTTHWWAIRDRAIIAVFLQTGIRVTALTEINMEDLSITYGTDGSVTCISLNITDKENEHYESKLIGDAAKYLYEWIQNRKEVLKDAKKETDALFLSRELERTTAKSVQNMVKRYAPEIDGKQITCHKFRATFARTLYNATGDIYFVQLQMHHKNASTTAIYVGTNNADRDRATDIINNMYFGGNK